MATQPDELRQMIQHKASGIADKLEKQIDAYLAKLTSLDPETGGFSFDDFDREEITREVQDKLVTKYNQWRISYDRDTNKLIFVPKDRFRQEQAALQPDILKFKPPGEPPANRPA